MMKNKFIKFIKQIGGDYAELDERLISQHKTVKQKELEYGIENNYIQIKNTDSSAYNNYYWTEKGYNEIRNNIINKRKYI